MSHDFRRVALIFCVLMARGHCVYAAPNPVLQSVADAGVLRFSGKYYLMGVHTDGGFHVSRNLVDWGPREHVFSMNNAWATGSAGADSEIHACDLVLCNGRFHLYWSVNYRMLRAIGHAVAESISGPYKEPDTERPFDGRIDPQLFIDDDGRSYFYTTKFIDGNVIYGQAMTGPDSLVGEARQLLSAIPDTWELRDHKVNEASFVRRYRDRYYMLYNANHTGHEYGNYGIGCAVAEGPLAFSNTSKYPYPVLRDNWTRIRERAKALSPVSLPGGVVWKFTEVEPSSNWIDADFDDSAWREGPGAFGNTDMFMFGGELRSHWAGDGIWLRRTFDGLDREEQAWRVYAYVNHDADARIYVNGVEAVSVSGYSGGYVLHELSEAAMNALRPGTGNTLAVHCAHDHLGAQYIDVGLYAFVGDDAEPVIYNCGQPTLVRGPNGFEWWLVYFAIFDGSGRRDQAIARTHFFDRELYVDGPVSAHTAGVYPAPSPPVFSDYFDGDILSDVWRPTSGVWRVAENELIQEELTGLHRVNLNIPVYDHYLFETTLRFLEGSGRQMGVIAWERGPEQALYIGLDREANTWFWVHRHEFLLRTEVFNMPGERNWDGPIALRVCKNDVNFRVYVDDIPAPGGGHIRIDGADAGRPGLVVRDSSVAYSGVVFTPGWDEFDAHIRGWADALDGTPATGAWGVGESGLMVESPSGEARVFKGDLLRDFEWSLQFVPGPDETGIVGCYAFYADRNNYLKVDMDAGLTRVVLTGKIQGEMLPELFSPILLREERPRSPEEGGVNVRVRRVGRILTLYVDGVEKATVEGDWPPAQVGLYVTNGSCRFNGITLFGIGSL